MTIVETHVLERIHSAGHCASMCQSKSGSSSGSAFAYNQLSLVCRCGDGITSSGPPSLDNQDDAVWAIKDPVTTTLPPVTTTKQAYITTTTISTTSNILSCKSDFTQFENTCYVVIDTALSYQEAAMVCQDLGAVLPDSASQMHRALIAWDRPVDAASRWWVSEGGGPGKTPTLVGGQLDIDFDPGELLSWFVCQQSG